MLTLKVDDIPDEGLKLRWREEEAALSAYLATLPQIDFGFEGPLESEVEIQKVGRSLLMRGRVQARLRFRCSRCLTEFAHPMASTFQLSLFPSRLEGLEEEVELEEEDMETGFFEGGEIRLSEMACEQVFLEVPYQPVCQEGCKGLCPACGRDLNLVSCDCSKEPFRSGFSALEKLKLGR